MPLPVSLLFVILVVYAIAELFRLQGRQVPAISEFTLAMSRPEERGHLIARPIFLAAGIILTLILFPRSIAYASITILAVGDPIAAYVGARFGRRYIRCKSWEGFVAGKKVSDEAIIEALKRLGSPLNAAKELGVSRATMYRLLNKHNLISEQTV